VFGDRRVCAHIETRGSALAFIKAWFDGTAGRACHLTGAARPGHDSPVWGPCLMHDSLHSNFDLHAPQASAFFEAKYGTVKCWWTLWCSAGSKLLSVILACHVPVHAH